MKRCAEKIQKRYVPALNAPLAYIRSGRIHGIRKSEVLSSSEIQEAKLSIIRLMQKEIYPKR